MPPMDTLVFVSDCLIAKSTLKLGKAAVFRKRAIVANKGSITILF
jgi:hypothetical protein